MAGNVVRGSLGYALRSVSCVPTCSDARTCPIRDTCIYGRSFEPRQEPGSGPSGFADLPRPFILRVAALNGKTLGTGDRFSIDIHFFSEHAAPPGVFARALAVAGARGFGPLRGRAELLDMVALNLDGAPFSTPRANELLFDSRDEDTDSAVIQFATATELKSGNVLVGTPDFPTLFARIRDRLRTLAGRYATPLVLDFDGLTRRSRDINLVSHALTWEKVTRTSSRTGHTHGLGGFRGEATYCGNLREFIPFLRAAHWCGVGRHTAWGKGELNLIGQNPSPRQLTELSPDVPK